MEPVKELDPNQGPGIAVAITITSQVHDRRNIVVQTYLDRDAATTTFNDVIDKLSKVVDRQEAKYQIKDEELRLQSDQMQLDNTMADLKALPDQVKAKWEGTNRRGEPKMEPQDRTRENTLKVNVEALRRKIDERKVNIKKFEAQIADTS